MSDTLRFTGGRFKVMQIADTQENVRVSRDTVRLIDGALERERPDLVVFTGDQIKGYNPFFWGRRRKEKISRTLSKILQPLVEREILFAVTFGNHDRQVGLSGAEQMLLYEAFPGCLARAGEVLEPGTQALPVLGRDGEPALLIYLIDSGGEVKGGGYEAVPRKTLDWYRKVRDRYELPGLVFQHIPIPEYYHLLQRVKRKKSGAVEAYRTHKHEFYRLDPAKVRPGGFMGEAPSVPDVNSGEGDALTEKGEILGLYCGHDHKNSFVGGWRGMDLGYAQSAGFNEYGPGVERAVRLFEIRETGGYETWTTSYQEVVGRRTSRPLKDFVLTNMPATREAGYRLIARSALAFLAVLAVAGIIWLI